MIKINKDFSFQISNNRWYAVNTAQGKQIEITNNKLTKLLEDILKDIDLFKHRKQLLVELIIVAAINELEGR